MEERLRAIMSTIVLLVSDCISLFFCVCLILIETVSAYYSALPLFNPLIAKSQFDLQKLQLNVVQLSNYLYFLKFFSNRIKFLEKIKLVNQNLIIYFSEAICTHVSYYTFQLFSGVFPFSVKKTNSFQYSNLNKYSRPWEI